MVNNFSKIGLYFFSIFFFDKILIQIAIAFTYFRNEYTARKSTGYDAEEMPTKSQAVRN